MSVLRGAARRARARTDCVGAPSGGSASRSQPAATDYRSDMSITVGIDTSRVYNRWGQLLYYHTPLTALDFTGNNRQEGNALTCSARQCQ